MGIVRFVTISPSFYVLEAFFLLNSFSCLFLIPFFFLSLLFFLFLRCLFFYFSFSALFSSLTTSLFFLYLLNYFNHSFFSFDVLFNFSFFFLSVVFISTPSFLFPFAFTMAFRVLLHRRL